MSVLHVATTLARLAREFPKESRAACQCQQVSDEGLTNKDITHRKLKRRMTMREWKMKSRGQKMKKWSLMAN